MTPFIMANPAQIKNLFSLTVIEGILKICHRKKASFS